MVVECLKVAIAIHIYIYLDSHFDFTFIKDVPGGVQDFR